MAYAIRLKEKYKKPFVRLSSPCSKLLPEANYKIWAEKDGTSRICSQVIVLNILESDTSNREVQLIVK